MHYDSHGNITTLQRTGSTPSSLIDDVSHSQQSYRVLNDFWLQPDQRAVFANDWEGLYTEHYRYGYDFDLNYNTGQGQNAQGQNIMIGANHFLHNGISVPLQATGYKIGN